MPFQFEEDKLNVIVTLSSIFALGLLASPELSSCRLLVEECSFSARYLAAWGDSNLSVVSPAQVLEEIENWESRRKERKTVLILFGDRAAAASRVVEIPHGDDYLLFSPLTSLAVRSRHTGQVYMGAGELSQLSFPSHPGELRGEDLWADAMQSYGFLVREISARPSEYLGAIELRKNLKSHMVRQSNLASQILRSVLLDAARKGIIQHDSVAKVFSNMGADVLAGA